VTVDKILLNFYSLLLAVLWPLIFLAFVWRFGLRRTFRGLGERLGGGPESPGDTLWVHAASVGEVKAVEPLLRRLPERFPGMRRLLTTTTVPGQELARKLNLAEEVRLAPLDLGFCAGRFLQRRRVKALALVETELWPNWLRTARARGVPVAVLNGRISDRSIASYLRLKFLWAPLLQGLRRVGAQSPEHARRWTLAGADPARVSVNGNLKYDAALPDRGGRLELFKKYRFRRSDHIWVCGSTHAGEEEVLAGVLAALLKRGDSLKMVLAPRHVERAGDVGRLLAARGLSFRLRTAAGADFAPADVLILDTVGELAEAYGLASAVFLGGSLAPRGGQNPLEPARWGAPLLFGPHMENFQDIADLLLAGGGAARVADGPALEKKLSAWKADPGAAAACGEAALRAARSQQGAVEKSLDLLEEILR
jgi:3-deoxy-D-manno-octulosonic-acid transferase